eukprot:TRINITY_DN1101_c0_g1_i1.p1 TRINITY_DN1101_c0_g1~~TRINITY_DN1101_c0_g1_i1.p1  ORF type:complete len:350 (+),score=119.16 TRINITY_DN1101_c0_g1_i1:45-1094(+)
MEDFQRANELFVDESYSEALEFYNKAINNQEKDEFYVNRSNCHQKLGNKKEALEDANKSLQLNPQNSKAHFRKGMALFDLENYKEAKQSFEQAVKLNPSQSTWETWIKKCKAELNETTTSNTTTTTNTNTNDNIPSTNTNTTTTTNTNTFNTNQKIRQEWYQTPTHIIITVFAKNITKENLTVVIKQKEVSINIKLGEGREYVSELRLLANVVPDQSAQIIYSTKIEVKMKKEHDAKWDSLEWKEQSLLRTFDQVEKSTPPSYPSSSKKRIDWDKIEVQEDELQGEDALNKVFKDIYKNGNEDQRKAMMKSFQESGGTVLSTNWDEIGKGKVEGKPPDGLIMKNWKDMN